MDKTIKPIDKIAGEIKTPGDKSISHRAVMLGAIAKGETNLDNFLGGEDCLRTVEGFRNMQVDIEITGKKVKIKGVGLKGLRKPKENLYLGNSGTTMRLISGILAAQDFEATLTGDESLSKRPMRRIIEPLTLMGGDIVSIQENGCAPLKIKGSKLKAIDYSTKVASAQVKSCVLLAGLYADGVTSVREPFQSRDHTERMLEFFGADMKSAGCLTSVKACGRVGLKAKRFVIPGDISSATFFIALATLLKGSALTIRSLGINPTRRKAVDVLLRMGANIKIENEKHGFEPTGDLKILGSQLSSTVITEDEVPQLIDEIPILTVCAAMADGKTKIHGLQELRIKETDRIFSMVENLRKMDVDITAENNTLCIHGQQRRFKPAVLDSFGDHRTAMAMSIAASVSGGECVIREVGCIETSFPTFFTLLDHVTN